MNISDFNRLATILGLAKLKFDSNGNLSGIIGRGGKVALINELFPDLIESELILSDVGSTTVDGKVSKNFSLLMTKDGKLANPSNYSPGDRITIVVKQDSVGGHALTYSTKYVFEGGVPVTLSTLPDSIDVLEIYVSEDNLFITTIRKAYEVVEVATMDATTLSEYTTAINGASVGSKRLAGANAIVTALEPDHRLIITRNDVTVLELGFTGSAQVIEDAGGVFVELGVPDTISEVMSADIDSGDWAFKLEGGASFSRELVGTVGPIGSDADLILTGDTFPGMGISENIRFEIPSELDNV